MMAVSYAADSFPHATSPVVEREALCGEMASYAKRLSEINSSFDSLIGRIGGPRPSQVQNKAEKADMKEIEPHLKEWSRRVGSEICSLEQSLVTLQQLIG